MIRKVLLLFIVLVVHALRVDAETKQQRDARMAWWREARFGMFVHWGLYSGLAGEWKGKKVGSRGGMEWLQQRVGADTWEYAHYAAPKFRPSKNFPADWAKLAKEAGCKYVVFTTKHHEGFALFDSKYTTYDAKDWTGRDLCAEIIAAIRKEGLKVGFYYSLIDWHHPQYNYKLAGRLPYPSKKKPSPNGPRDMEIYLRYMHSQVKELMSNYGKVDIVWWDYSLPGSEGKFWHADELLAMVRKLQPQIVSNNRLYTMPSINSKDQKDRLAAWDPKQGDFTTPEQRIPSTGAPGVDWETCMTMNTTWGYSKYDNRWKTPKQLIRNLVDIVSKGGNFLLNVGPKGDGSIPQESVKIMQAIGKWMKVNSDSIYGTTASPFKAPQWGRYTKKQDMLFIHVFDWPKKPLLTIPVSTDTIAKIWLLSDKNRTPLKLRKNGAMTDVSLPQQAPDSNDSVLELKYKKKH